MRFIPSHPIRWSVAAAVIVVAAGVLVIRYDMLPRDLFAEDSATGLPSPSPSPSATPQGPLFALPASCADIGAGEITGGLAPEGTVVDEEATEIDDVPDAEQMSCAWFTGGASDPGSESFALSFTVNTDPAANAEVVQVPGAQEDMDWEVDVDVDVETYRTSAADEFGGELEFVSTADGSSKHLYLSLPGDFHVSAIAVSSEATKEEMEQVVLAAAEKAER